MKHLLLILTAFSLLAAAQQESAPPRPVGTVQSVQGDTIVLKTDSGASLTVRLQAGGRVMRAAPGGSPPEKVQLQDVQVGDRMVVARGTPDEASAIIIMKQTDVASRQQQEQRAWQRGAGGIVSSIDQASGDITVKSTPTQTVLVHTSPKTSFLRYSPDSVQFKDASASSLDQIKPGDQLRARGSRNTEGTEISADQVIAGTFRNIAGTVLSVAPAEKTLIVQDLTTKKPVQVKITSDSQMHQLPTVMATRVAMMLKGAEGRHGEEGREGHTASSAAPATGNGPAQSGWSHTGGGAPDFQQMISRTPPVAIADLKKGDAVMIVATTSANPSTATAITLISGVEPILTASPNGSGAATLLSNWSLGATGGGDGGPQ